MELKAQISAITGAAKETTDAEAETTEEGGGPLVTDADIANIVAQWTGIPVEKVCSPQNASASKSLWEGLALDSSWMLDMFWGMWRVFVTEEHDIMHCDCYTGCVQASAGI